METKEQRTERKAIYIAKATSLIDTEEIRKEVEAKWEEANGICIGCEGRATRTNNTLCNRCWQDTEGENE